MALSQSTVRMQAGGPGGGGGRRRQRRPAWLVGGRPPQVTLAPRCSAPATTHGSSNPGLPLPQAPAPYPCAQNDKARAPYVLGLCMGWDKGRPQLAQAGLLATHTARGGPLPAYCRCLSTQGSFPTRNAGTPHSDGRPCCVGHWPRRPARWVGRPVCIGRAKVAEGSGKQDYIRRLHARGTLPRLNRPADHRASLRNAHRPRKGPMVAIGRLLAFQSGMQLAQCLHRR